MTYASWISGPQVEMWKSASAGSGDVAGALQFVNARTKTPPQKGKYVSRYIQDQHMDERLQENRQAVARANPCPEEFLAIMVLMFFG